VKTKSPPTFLAEVIITKYKPVCNLVHSLLTIGNTMHYNASIKTKMVAEKVRLNSLCIMYYITYVVCALFAML